MSQDEIQLGRYRHYKNKQYTVLGLVYHSETQEQLVLYRPEYGERLLWVRPREMFFEDVIVDGKRLPRFDFIGEADSE
ncbi:MAG: DUF1653 domain-containing protein [Planctomycetaceae bacterium]|jgi:hypothetical protein|nr:DUF1653 domain-containing protein [Planctomycetaceae bacterium]